VDDKVIIVSSDSHAGVPKELWSEYLDPRFHELIPTLRQDNVVYPTAIFLMTRKGGSTTLPEIAEAHGEDYHGLHDPVLRLADMDREGIAAEMIYHGDFRLGDMFHNATNRQFPFDAWDAGAKAWNRWAADAFGFATDRFLLTAAVGPCTDMDAAVAEIHWIADHGFAATYGPGYMTHPDLKPLHDPSWDPYWAACAERDIPLVVHAGFGSPQGVVFPQLQRIYDDVARAAGSTDFETMLDHSDAVAVESLQFFNAFTNGNIDSRRPMWQLMFGGVFDRHPGLKLILTEIRLDWIPATLRHLDALYEEHRADLPAQRRPSEYWADNCLAGASFIHKVEVEMRHEIGLETIAFGRDYPHPEGTWPNTRDWVHLAFEDVPDDEVRLMVGENAVRFLGLDHDRLRDIAKRIGPSMAELKAGGGPVRDELVANFAQRGGFLKPAEGDARVPLVDAMVREDFSQVVAGV
jgi:predicted TIM-barrel fold metal-dependent hydrolase